MKGISASVLALAVAATVGSSAVSAQGGPAPHSDRARVIRVEHVGGGGYEREECWNERTNNYESGYYRDSSGRLYRGDSHTNTGGMLLGALVGGALGNQVGKGDGRKAATVAGAVIGGAIGAHAGNNNDNEYRDDHGMVRRCRTIVDDNGPDGYNVTYVYAGQTYQAFTRDRPGRSIPVMVDVRPQN